MKNILDVENKRPTVIDDRTGQVLQAPRGDLAETLRLVYEVQTLLYADPTVPRGVASYALRAFCEHMGWTPTEIAAADQYVTLFAGGGAPTAAR